ncbi:hypothetical protein [Ruegeria lacuscaerulensis]|uniref:hypothetical protein n=1 Tax=Ruegeria lacuscaerulensis TaxID=55218 RepID=UPI00147D6EC5|nr:hypothetical protein [Ruegeria lacuscaerulensis]
MGKSSSPLADLEMMHSALDAMDDVIPALDKTATEMGAVARVLATGEIDGSVKGDLLSLATDSLTVLPW